jgi:hypothetical protein
MDELLPSLNPVTAVEGPVQETVQVLPNGYLEDALIGKIQDIVPLRVSGGTLVMVFLVLFIRRLIAASKGSR